MEKKWRDAVLTGDVDLVERLLVQGHPVDSRDQYGQTALMLAALHGHTAVAELLLANRADPDVTAKFGLSALMLAIINRHTVIAEGLIDAGADPSLRGTGAPGFAGKTAGDLARDAGLDALADSLS